MKVFLKWFLGSILFLLFLTFLPVVISEHENVHYFEGMIFILIGSFALACLFYYLEVKYVPRRKEKLTNKIIDIFGAYPVNEDITRFTVVNLNIYTEIKIQLLLLEHHGYTESILFHIPKEQIDALLGKPFIRLKRSTCNGMETYLVYEASGWALKRTKRKLEKKVGDMLHLPLT